jgi:peptidyl-dipeptidase Dcp
MTAQRFVFVLAVASCLTGCSDDSAPDSTGSVAASAADVTANSTSDAAAMTTNENPFFTPSTLDLQFPRFDLIRNEHYLPAFERGVAEQLAEISEIVNQTAAPNFANTIIPYETSGQMLNRMLIVFYAMSSAHTNEDIQTIEAEIAPRLAAHNDQILLNETLFGRVKAIHDQKENMGLDAESLRLVEETYKDFVHAGAQLPPEQKEQLKAMNTELSELETRFSQNVLNEVNDSAVVVDTLEELAGMTEDEIQAAADAATERNLEGKYVIALLNTSGQPPLATLQNRALRERIQRTSEARGSRGGEYDNREIISRVATLRAQKAALLGYPNHAAYVLEKQTAQTPAAVNEMLAQITPPAIANARIEAGDLQAMVEAEGGDFELASWDWAFYSEKVRQQRYNFDESQLRPYLEFNNVLEKGVFYAANQIYGLSFTERFDLPVYQEDVRVFEVHEENGTLLALFMLDPYARASKQGGAWMNDYVAQSSLLGTRPVVGNHLNIPQPPQGAPTLMTFDEVTTMFHEFGHALHGMFSNVTYPSFSGTNVPRDFVEYPSQVNEMWATWPEVLKNYAVHYETGEAMPTELLDKVLESRKFNQGFFTSEYLMATISDMALHQLTADEIPAADQLMQFEEDALKQAGAYLTTVPPRYRIPYFSHIMGGYSAGYYSYIWSEVLDADTVEWFKENGGMTRANGQHFRDTLLSRGGSEEAISLFVKFRGAEPDIEPLLERRGLQ